MTPEEVIESDARLLYEQRTWVAPTWDQLGEVTKEVWRERVRAGQEPSLA